MCPRSGRYPSRSRLCGRTPRSSSPADWRPTISCSTANARSGDLGKVSACLDLLRAMAGTKDRAAVRSTQQLSHGRRSCIVRFGVRRARHGRCGGARARPDAARAQHHRAPGLRIRGALDFRRLRGDACRRGRRRQRQLCRAALGCGGVAARSSDCHHGQERKGSRLAHRHDALRASVAVLCGMGRDASRRSRRRARRDSAPRLCGARRRCRAQLLEDARGGDRGPAAAAVLECGDAAVHDGDSEAAPRRVARVLHDRRGSRKSKRSASRARERKWNGALRPATGRAAEFSTSSLGPGAEQLA